MRIKNEFNWECITYSQMDLIFNARIAWRRLTIWIRAYVVSRYMGIGTAEEIFERLYIESLEFGDMLKIIFGRNKAEEYTRLLSNYIIAFRSIIDAHISGDVEATNKNVNLLYQNAEERAAYLNQINPYLNEAEWNTMFSLYIQGTLAQINSFLSGNYDQDIEKFTELIALTDKMGDAFAQGIYDYLTSGDKSANLDNEPCLNNEQMNAIYDIRMLWFELASWIRSYMLSRYRGIGNEEQIYNRLRELPVEYANNLRLFFGEKPGIDQLELLINNYFELIDALITAQIEGNTEEMNRITRLLYQNADERAKAVASVNPKWDETEWRVRLYNNLRSTLEESTTFLTGDYGRNLDIFSRLIDQAESASDYFAEGLLNYINEQRQQ